MRLLASGIVLSLSLIAGPTHCRADNQWGGSLGVTSDYFVRGISRSNDGAALQLDLHYLNNSGFMAGFFASNTQIDPDEPKDVELNEFIGYARNIGDDWRGKAVISHYTYPWNKAGSQYNYDELDLEVTYQDWLDLVFTYSPNASRYRPTMGLLNVDSESIEVNLQRPLQGRLSGIAGVGYSYLGGSNPAGYVYWSAGLAYDLRPLSLTLSYVDTTAAAKSLFYDGAATGRWTGTVIWRF